jgi:hypothetical protein
MQPRARPIFVAAYWTHVQTRSSIHCGSGAGPGGLRVADGQADRAGALPRHDSVLDALGEVGRRDELEVDVQQRRAVEADEQTRLADVVAGERAEQRAEGARERLRVREQLPVVGTARPYRLP